jgi:hypothetical protein
VGRNSTDPRLLLALWVCATLTNAGSDGEELPPMLDRREERFGKNPAEALVDGG